MQTKTAFAAVLACAMATLGAAAHAQYGPRQDLDRDGIQNRYDRDRDGDGIPNARDPNPNVRNYVRTSRLGPYGDLDRDGVKNRWDRDRDGDGVPNVRDRYPDNRRFS